VIASPEARVRAVERGRADLMWFGSSDRSSFLAGLSALRREYASQLHLSPLTQTNFLSLNTRVSPFNDVRVRRAANYAFDRNGLVDRVGGPDLARASCQVLPPNTEGYRRYCPYTRNRTADGKYTGPDLARARKLVAASGTKGQSVTVWILKSFAPYAASLVSALKKIGYHARLHVIKDADGQQYVAAISDSRRRVQASGMTWAPDYAAASGFIPALLSCRSFRPASPNQNINVAEFCNRAIDVEITRARALQTSDPPTASRLWSKIDRDIVDQAPWVVQLNPIEPVFVARRVGNYQYNPQYGVLYDQLWVR
jgi:peptide/nickel transport system substrate-binding protein